MTKPAGQEAHATNVPPAAAAGSDPFGLAPWLREMPGVSMHPLMANPMAAMAATTAAPVVAKKTEPVEKPAKAAPARKATRARVAKTDDLKVISGVGPKLEQVLNGMGVTRYADIAAWSASDVARIEAELGLDGRIARDGWVEQASKGAGERLSDRRAGK